MNLLVAFAPIKKGSTGVDVECWQALLKARGYLVKGKVTSYGTITVDGVDGDFGNSTDYATKQFQKDNGLSVDGNPGVNSWAKILYR